MDRGSLSASPIFSFHLNDWDVVFFSLGWNRQTVVKRVLWKQIIELLLWNWDELQKMTRTRASIWWHQRHFRIGYIKIFFVDKLSCLRLLPRNSKNHKIINIEWSFQVYVYKNKHEFVNFFLTTNKLQNPCGHKLICHLVDQKRRWVCIKCDRITDRDESMNKNRWNWLLHQRIWCEWMNHTIGKTNNHCYNIPAKTNKIADICSTL